MKTITSTNILFYTVSMILLSGEINHLFAQKVSACPNSDFSAGDFTNWVGHTSIYPYNTPGTNLGTNAAPYPSPPYYYNTGIVNGRQTIITTSRPDPFTCGNVMTLPPNEKVCVRLGNGGIGTWGNGVGWQRDYLDYTFAITPANALLIYKYAVVLQDPPLANGLNNHTKELRPRFIVSIKDQAGNLIDPVCGKKEDFADTSVLGYRNCALADAEALGANAENKGNIVYRAWTTVGVDLRKFIGQNITIGFETWDCGLGGHFAYAYLMARCDSLGIIAAACSQNGAVTLTAPEGFAYKWSTGQTTKVIEILNAKPGDVATVELTTLSGCKTSLSTKIYPMFTKANFILSPTSVCLNDPITVKDSSYSYVTSDNSSVPIVEWRYNFGDGTFANSKDATHIYKKPGVYKVFLKVMNKNGCVDSIGKTVTVLPAPFASFSVDDICMNGTASFIDESVNIGGGVITKGWQWTFGDDNSTSTLQNPTHIFQNSGTFAVKLSISDLGCTDDTVVNIKVFPLPVADFVATETCVGFATVFTDNSKTSDNADVVSKWIWDFGDGSALSSSKHPEHYYSKEGTYTVSLIVTTAKGCIGTIKKVITVRAKPIAKFSATPLCLSEPVIFTDESTPAGEIIEWYWSFNDKNNSHSTSQNTQWKYDTSSIYLPTLFIKSKYGCSDSFKLSLNIPPLPFVNFDADLYEHCVPLDVKFMDFSFSSSDKIKTWNWDFGDGSPQDTSKTPSHSYVLPGTYSVTLSVTTANSCKATHTWFDMMHAYPIPKAGFIFSPEEPTESDNTLTFYDRSQGAVFWNWDFGDQGLSAISSSIEREPVHTYPLSGTFTIWQFVTSDHGCIDSISETVTIKPDWTFYVPNTFTPNGDGKNDSFIPEAHNVIEFQMWIFDRWGNMIYTTDKTTSPSTATPWNGHANGGSKTAQEDVYVWLVELKDINNQYHKYIGHVTLVR